MKRCKSSPRNIPQKGSAAMLMVGIAIPQDIMSVLAAKDRYPGIQGHNHQWAVIRGIEEAAGRPIDLLSTVGIGDYPRHPTILMRGGRWQHCPGAEDAWLPLVNLFPLKQIMRFLLVGIGILRWLFRHRRCERKVIFLYSTASPQFYAVLLATLCAKTYRIAIVTDPPSVDLPGEGLIRRLARKLDRQLQMSAMRRVQGLAVLAESLATDFAPGVPYRVFEGIAPNVPRGLIAEKRGSGRFRTMYAGTLVAEYGMQLLCDSLPLLPDDVELWIYGRGPFEGRLREYASRDSRLKILGFKPHEEIFNAVQFADALVNPRPKAGWFTRYSFPSKLLEYLATGCPVISTRLPTIPPEYEPYMIWIEEDSPKGLAQAIWRLRNMDEQERVAFGRKGQEFVQLHKSERSQGVAMWEFVTRVAGLGGSTREVVPTDDLV